jgi:hypothetical protein
MNNVPNAPTLPPAPQQRESGAASLFIELREGTISVYHGTLRELLLGEISNAMPGAWNELLACIKARPGYVEMVDDL